VNEPAGAHRGGGGLRAAVPVALARGLAAFVVVSLAGQIPPLLIQLFGGGLAWVTALKLGWLYTLMYHHVAIELRGQGSPDGAVVEVVHVGVALLTGTALALWLLYRGGCAAGRAAGGGSLRRSVAGAMVAIPYAVPILLVTLAVRLELATGGGLLPDLTTLAGAPWQAFVLPLAIGLVAGGVGGLLTTASLDARVRTWIVGGWRTFVTALGLAIVALLVFAAVRPAGTAAYARSLGPPRRAALEVGNQALALPNHALFVLVPSMGGCDALRGADTSVDLLCMGRFPLGDIGARALGLVADVARGREPGDPTRPMRSLAAFLLVPLLATVAGGRLAARGRRRVLDRLGAGMGSAVVFATLVAIGAWASSIEVDAQSLGGAGGDRIGLVLGPRPLAAGALALAWGVGGAAVGALVPERAQTPGVGAPPAGDAGPAPVPPSPTSV
jgi:hypothetical protein